MSHRGRFHRFDDITIGPVPVQRPHPPIRAGGNAGAVLTRAARLCDGFVPIGTGAAGYRELWEQVARLAEAHDRDPGAITRAVHVYSCMDADPQTARRIVENTLSERDGFAVTLPDHDRHLVGPADHCARVIESYAAAGVEHFVINPARPIQEVPGAVASFANEVMARFR